jgi:hypothetical protein
MSGYDNEYRCEECNSYVCECGIEEHPKGPVSNLIQHFEESVWDRLRIKCQLIFKR